MAKHYESVFLGAQNPMPAPRHEFTTTIHDHPAHFTPCNHFGLAVHADPKLGAEAPQTIMLLLCSYAPPGLPLPHAGLAHFLSPEAADALADQLRNQASKVRAHAASQADAALARAGGRK